MNKMLERAFAEVAKLPEEEQEAIASRLLEELEIERGWDERFARSQDKLAEMARKAKEQHARGETTPLVFPADE
jgi:hypothetical protein